MMPIDFGEDPKSIFMGFVVLTGMLFGPYWVSMKILVPIACKSNPAGIPGLFATTCAVQIAPALAVVLLASNGEGTVPLLGWLGWVLLGPRRMALKDRILVSRWSRPLPKMQFVVGDAFVAVLYFAVLMTVFTQLPDITPGVLFCAALYLLASSTVAFLAAQDIVRRAEWPPDGGPRGIVFLGCLIYFSATGIIGGLIAWLAWHCAIRKAQLKRAQHLDREADEERAVAVETK